eukprot:COSAG02_NODE_17211_length_1021_cov_0.845987_1_plen_66_part_00
MSWVMDIFTPNELGYDNSRYANVMGDVVSLLTSSCPRYAQSAIVSPPLQCTPPPLAGELPLHMVT